MANCIILSGGTWNKDDWSKLQRSVGPYRIASALEDAGYTTFVFDYIINFTLEEIKQVLDQHLGDDTVWVGFSSTFFWFPDYGKTHGNGDILKLKEMWWIHEDKVSELLAYLKSKNVKLVYGGTKAEFFLGQESAIDYYVMGLADTAVIALTDSIKHNDPALLPYKEEHINNDGSVSWYIDCRHYPEPQMNQIRTHWWKPHFNILPREAISIELARGCIFKCKFCTYPLLGKKKGTYLRDAMEIRDDLLRNYEAYGTTDYFITDDTVNDDTDKLIALRDAFATLPFKPRLTGFFRLDLINRWPEQAQILLDMGVVGVFFGIETLHPESAKSIGKGLHPDKVKKCLNWLAHDVWKGKVNIGGGIILGLPHDTMEYFEELREWAMDPMCPMHHIQFYPLHLNRVKDTDRRGMYVSEFNLHPDIYGYEFPGDDNYMLWQLPQQELSYTLTNQIAKEFNKQRSFTNKVAGFEMPKWLNLGIPIEDLYAMSSADIAVKYNIPALNQARLAEYKQLLGLPINTNI